MSFESKANAEAVESEEEAAAQAEAERLKLENERAENRRIAKELGVPLLEVSEFRETFNLVDKDHGGSIDEDELAELMELLGMHKSKEVSFQVLSKGKRVGTSGELRVVSIDRPTRPTRQLSSHGWAQQDMQEMMQEVDTSGTGEVLFQDFVKVMSKKVVADYTAEEVMDAFRKFADKYVGSGRGTGRWETLCT